ncbi:hypothetical protein [Bacillus toyonensis]|uniref:hypothetical protein n=1 Tax=Bacillus toyonensis TaxID=155322 RepID=UPI002E237FFF|nr:hypothetical protein [Bacillus toyonensis]
MAKDKIPGDNVIWRLKKNERAGILEWVNAQTNVTDAIRFLVESDIELNGIRNLAEETPSKRSDEFFENYIDREISRLVNLKNLLAEKSNKEKLMVIKHQDREENNYIVDEAAATKELPKVEEKAVVAPQSTVLVSDEKANPIEMQSEAIETKEESVVTEKTVELEEETVQLEKQVEPVSVVKTEKVETIQEEVKVVDPVETTTSNDSSVQVEVAKNSDAPSKTEKPKKKKQKVKVNMAAVSKAWS